jgi:hypothetical protein
MYQIYLNILPRYIKNSFLVSIYFFKYTRIIVKIMFVWTY